MTLPKTKKGKSGDDSSSGGEAPHIAPERRNLKRTPTGDLGNALRSVYDGALNEEIPPEMLDLLGKLD